MIPAWPETLALAAAVTALFTIIGLPLARAIALPRIPPLALAPTLGWAATMALALPALTLAGFATLQVTLLAAACLAAAAWALARSAPPAAQLSRWHLILAAAPALLPLAAVMPKHAGGGIRLAPPMFDHVKIAVVDAILRNGLPVPNPFAGPPGPGRLAYYYLWHVSGAFAARLFHTGGWQAEAALTFFTAFASLMLMLGIATALGGRTIGALAVAALSLPGSLRPLLVGLLGSVTAPALIPYNSDIGNWLNQAAWVPQHLQSACCVLLSCLLIPALASRPWRGTLWPTLCLAFTAAAGFESSAWVGGPGFAAAAALLGAVALVRARGQHRLPFLLSAVAAACLAAALVAPVALAEIAATHARNAGAGIAAGPYPVFGPLIPTSLRPWADLAGFWPFLLLLFPAIAPGAAAYLLAARARCPPETLTLALTALAVLCVAWLFHSTFDNNDLGWRVVLPALLAATPMAAAWLARATPIAAVAATAFAAAGLVQTAVFASDYTLGQRPGQPAAFADAAETWAAIRAHTAPLDRIANNPHALEHVTPWPVNIGWALLSDRPSCYAGWETAIAYAPMPRAALLAMNGRSRRIFAGIPVGTDLQDLIHKDHCAAILVTSQDGAWQKPFWHTTNLFAEAASGNTWTLYRALPTTTVPP